MNLFVFLSSLYPNVKTDIKCYILNNRKMFIFEIEGLHDDPVGKDKVSTCCLRGESILECFRHTCAFLSNKAYYVKRLVDSVGNYRYDEIQIPELTIYPKDILGENVVGWVEQREGRLKVL